MFTAARVFDSETGLAHLMALKGATTIAVCLPARDEAATVGRLVESIRRALVDRVGFVDELIVVDDRSTDSTARVAEAAGARIVSSDAPLVAGGEEAGPGGKGQAMWASLHETAADIVVWLDADLTEFRPDYVTSLAAPLLAHDELALVKGFYDRPLHGVAGEGGRTTELVARPLLSLMFPGLTSVWQPLGGEYAGRRSVLERLPFVAGYGVDIALLIDVARISGLYGIGQVDLGVRRHRHRPLDELGVQAMEIIQTVLDRAGVPMDPDWSSTLVRPGRPPVDVELVELPPVADLAGYRGGRAVA